MSRAHSSATRAGHAAAPPLSLCWTAAVTRCHLQRQRATTHLVIPHRHKVRERRSAVQQIGL